MAIAMENRMLLQVNEAVRIASRSTIWTGLTFPGQSHSHTIIHPGRNLDFQFHFVWLQALAIASFARLAYGFSAASANRASRLHS
jgi:hypothetical protein